MTLLRLAFRALVYHWRASAAVGSGVAAATAVLTGALLVGDSVRGSLRHLTLDRLGRIDALLLVDRFFREQLVTDLASAPAFSQHCERAVGVMLFPQATIEQPGANGVTRAANVLVVASPSSQEVAGEGSFWSFEEDAALRPSRCPDRDEIILNQTLADELQADVGDRVTLRLPKAADIPADSPLGEKADRIRSFPRLRVIEIVPAAGLGQFSLTPTQTLPANAYVSLEQLQSGLDQPGRVNSILVAARAAPGAAAATPDLASALRPTLDDLGLTLSHVRLYHPDLPSEQAERIYDYFSLSSQSMILPPAVEAAAHRAFAGSGGQSVFTYLANRLESVSQPEAVPLPYSTITALDPSDDFQLLSVDGQHIAPPGPDEIVLTDWAADDLGVAPGDLVRLTYFEPETTHGAAVEAQQLLTVQAIAPLTRPAEPYLPSRRLQFTERPTIANDPALTPVVKGFTDQQSIDDWEVPFTIDYRLIRSQDDAYWENYATTPKAYVSLATGRRLWGSRFGAATSYRLPARAGLTADAIERQLLSQLAHDGVTLGFEFQPIKARQLAASSGNTPFDMLFLSLSFFIIVAALLLVALLFRLGFDQRAAQVGLLLALGWSVRRVRRVLVAEGLTVAAAGSALGVLIGLGYAGLILAGLQSKSWWLGAISAPFLTFHWTARSLLIGYTAGVLATGLTIFWSVFQTRRVPARRLLSGQVTVASPGTARQGRAPVFAAAALVVVAAVLAGAASSLAGQQQAGAFVGAGAALLTAMLLGIWHALRSGSGHRAAISGRFPLLKLAARSAARNPGRSTLTIGLIATASFLIVAMSAFQLEPTETGTGGFELVAESSQPIFEDLNAEVDWQTMTGPPTGQLPAVRVYSFRVRPGDDASCGNLYRSNQPRILGVPQDFVSAFDSPRRAARFRFSKSAAHTAREQANPWHILSDRPTPPGEPIPAVIDQETAIYSLKLYRGIGERFTFTYDGRPVEFRVAGLLSLSILHGNLLISDADFRQLFPAISGHRYFLIDTQTRALRDTAQALEDRWSDEGCDATESRSILASLMTLQNTYLRTFQSLGALGLLLGTFGLAAVQLRSVLERRGEMGLLRAAGFRRRRLAQLVLLENILLLLAGLAAGVAAALLAVIPHMFGGGAAVPFRGLGAMLLIVLIVGIIAGAWAARATLRVPLLAALREER